MKLLKAIIPCLVLMFAAPAALPVCADHISEYDPGKLCTLNVKLTTDNGKNAAGAEMMLCQVADAEIVGDGFAYEWTAPFAECPLTLDVYESPMLADDLYTYAMQHGIQGTSLFTDADGLAKFENLRCGLYIAWEVGNPGESEAINPFMITLPRVMEDEIFYESTAFPKVAAERSTSLRVHKVWNDDGKKRPADVQVQLLRGDQVYDTVTLSAANNWSAEWDSILLADDWKVREVSVPAGYTVSYQQDGMTFTVVNTASDTLIQTGQLNRPIPFLAGGGLALMLLGTALISSGRKREDEQD